MAGEEDPLEPTPNWSMRSSRGPDSNALPRFLAICSIILTSVAAGCLVWHWSIGETILLNIILMCSATMFALLGGIAALLAALQMPRWPYFIALGWVVLVLGLVGRAWGFL